MLQLREISWPQGFATHWGCAMTTKTNRSGKRKMTREIICGTPLAHRDPEIQRLDRSSPIFAKTDRDLVLPAEIPTAPRKLRGLLIPMLSLPRLAAAAVILLALGATLFFSLRQKQVPDAGPAWDVGNSRARRKSALK